MLTIFVLLIKEGVGSDGVPVIHQSRSSDRIQWLKFATLSSTVPMDPISNPPPPDISPPPMLHGCQVDRCNTLCYDFPNYLQ
jgi:hypothetical protein